MLFPVDEFGMRYCQFNGLALRNTDSYSSIGIHRSEVQTAENENRTLFSFQVLRRLVWELQNLFFRPLVCYFHQNRSRLDDIVAAMN